MSTNEALLTNCRAIQLVDDLDPDAAHALFRQNYRAHPSLMTSVNYAAFLPGIAFSCEKIRANCNTISRFTCAICLRLFPSGVRSFHLA